MELYPVWINYEAVLDEDECNDEGFRKCMHELIHERPVYRFDETGAQFGFFQTDIPVLVMHDADSEIVRITSYTIED